MDRDTLNRYLLINNRIDELMRVNDFIEKTAKEWNLPSEVAFSVTLAMEEALTNIISYGFEDKMDHKIDIHFSRSAGELTVSIVDDGKEYDPTLQAEPDITLPAEQRSIGGLGIFLIKKMMDSVNYRRADGKNRLILKKTYK